jgi:hypothetical protein
MIPRSHPLAGVREAFNAVFVEADAAGQLMFYGRGAGGDPTASAVLGDVVAVAPAPGRRRSRTGESAYADLPILPMGNAQTRYHISLDVATARCPRGGGVGVRRPRRVDRDGPPADRPAVDEDGSDGRATSSSSRIPRPTPRSRRPSRRSRPCPSSARSTR